MNTDIESNICKNIPWAQLPSHIKQLLKNSQKDYEKCVINVSLKKQLRYRGNLVRQVYRDEEGYYELLVRFSMENLMLYPYHLADIVVKGLRVTPFNYYTAMVALLMEQEKSYDTLPNFTAADCLRLLGIGRNEYIELMNRSRSGRGKLFRNAHPLPLLPRLPVDIHIEPWWRLDLGYVLEDDIKLVSEPERELIDKLIDLGSQTVGELDFNVVKSLYKRGLVYLDVPITGLDCVSVPPLQGFVMNRLTGDYFETLLYKIFVSIDEHTPIAELAAMLQIEMDSVKQAVSLYCRLGFAHKKLEHIETSCSKLHPSWENRISPARQSPVTPLTFAPPSSPPSSPSTPIDLSHSGCIRTGSDSSIGGGPARSGPRIGFLFDSALTAFLMMGNLSPGLKNHAVTMFEVGKLCDESLDSFLTELEKVSLLDCEGEGDAYRFFAHAVHLRSTVIQLRRLSPCGLDLLRQESLQALDSATCERLLHRKYKLLVSMAPLGREGSLVSPPVPPHLGPATPEVNSLWFKLFIYHMSGYGPPSLLLTKGTVIRHLPRLFLGYSKLLFSSWYHEPAVISSTTVLSINESLKYSAVLLQAYGVRQTAATCVVPFPFDYARNENTQTLKWSRHPAVGKLLHFVDLDSTCGYLTFVNTGVMDIGCDSHDPVVRLGRPQKTNNAIGTLSPQIITIESTTISNENFSFVTDSTKKTSIVTLEAPHIIDDLGSELVKKLSIDNSSDLSLCDKLQSPNESYFSVTPVKSSLSNSPANGFTCLDCNDILREELDSLEADESHEPVAMNKKSKNMPTVDDLMSPTDENISMFSRMGIESQIENVENMTGKGENNNKHEEISRERNSYEGEEWTLLECNFGVPLFEVDANTKICDAIINKLYQPENLQKLLESNQKLGARLLEFISQCQYYPGENMGIIKRGRLTPQPKKCLVFENGKVNIWPGDSLTR